MVEEKNYYEGGPTSKVILVWLTRRIIHTILFVLIIGVFYGFLAIPFVAYLTIALIILLLIQIIYSIFLRKTYHYKITNKGVYFEGGIIIKRKDFVPFYKITNTATSQNLVERTLGISKLGIQTAGTGYGRAEITFEGLEDAERPRKIIQQLLEYTRRSSPDRYGD